MLASNQLAITANRENILYDGCEELANDLKQIDPTLYASFFQYGEARFVYEAVNSILDKHFIKGAMTFACTGDALIPWGESPVIAIDMEFVSDGIFAFFRIILTKNNPIVELHHIVFHESAGDPEANTEQLRKSIAAARL